MNSNIENAAKNLLSTPKGAKILGMLNRVNGAMAGESGKELLILLSGSGGDAIKEAAAQALRTDKDRGRAFMSSIMNSKDGSALLAKIIEVSGKK